MRLKHPERLEDALHERDRREVSFVALFEGWLDDLLRLHASIRAQLGGRDWELVVVDNPVDERASERIAALDRVVHVPLAQRMGFGGARNLGVRQATGRLCVVADTSVELTGDVLPRLGLHLGRPDVGLVGPWGVVTADGFDFDEPDAPEPVDVHAVQAYFMAARRSTFREVGLFDPKFKWYRNADLDFSFKVRAAGLRALADPALPAVRHEHRLWESTPAAVRDETSRRNFRRFRDHWGDRPDLLELRA